MMQLLIAQIESLEGQIDANLTRALEVIDQADQATELVIFPETHLTGFAQPDHIADRALTLDSAPILALIEKSRANDIAIATGFLEMAGDQVFNTSVLITPESGIALKYRKVHLWPDEADLISAGDRFFTTEWRGIKVGLMICYDIEFPESARALSTLGCDLMLVTNGNMAPYGPVHFRAAQARAQENQCFLAMTNRIGDIPGQHFVGESALFSPLGETLFQADETETLQSVQIDFAEIEQAKRAYDYAKDRRFYLLGERVEDGDIKAWVLPI